MNAFLLELPYVLVPFAMTMICRNVNYSLREYTFYGTGILIFLYPALLVLVENMLEVNTSCPLIDHHLVGYFLINTLFFVPLTLLLQLIFNAILLRDEKMNGTKLSNVFLTQNDKGAAFATPLLF